MLTDILSLQILAQGQQPAPGGGSSMMMQLGMIALMFGAFYFLLIAPQRKRQKAHQKMLAALAQGDRVITNGGIHGTVMKVADDRLTLRIAENTQIELGRQYVAAKLDGSSRPVEPGKQG